MITKKMKKKYLYKKDKELRKGRTCLQALGFLISVLKYKSAISLPAWTRKTLGAAKLSSQRRARAPSFCFTQSAAPCLVAFAICPHGKTDSMQRHLLEAMSETADVLELRQKASVHLPVWEVVVYGIGLPTTALRRAA